MAVGLFTYAIPAWLAANGASVAQVGAVVGAAMVEFAGGALMLTLGIPGQARIVEPTGTLAGAGWRFQTPLIAAVE